jgi:hypothetical protein
MPPVNRNQPKRTDSSESRYSLDPQATLER